MVSGSGCVRAPDAQCSVVVAARAAGGWRPLDLNSRSRRYRAVRPEGFPRTHRLRKRSEFESVYAEGTKQVEPRFVLFTRPNGLQYPRLGITATRRLGNAVVRNRARRLVREAFRSQWEGFAVGYDYVVVARPGTLESRPADLLPGLLALAARATGQPA